MEDRPLRIAVLGTGPWWGYQHARLYHSRPDTELVGILGRTQERADARAAQFGVTGLSTEPGASTCVAPSTASWQR